jgi:hypothetical protein
MVRGLVFVVFSNVLTDYMSSIALIVNVKN